MDEKLLNETIVKAKAATYVGDGVKVSSSRVGSHDLSWSEGEWQYLDSYFGGTDFLGQETLWFRGNPVWAMNYYGYIRHPSLIDAQRAGETIKAALSAMYREGRFLGGWTWKSAHGEYFDESEGDATHFHGREFILVDGIEAYCLDYFGGIIRA
jgi:hypothetical protein